VKVIGAGFGRTGTTSLKTALEKLGFGPCYHMTEVFAHPEHADVWSAAGRGEPADLESVLEGYDATLDWPACTFYEEFMERHPEAKVLLSVRDPERWYESTRTTIYELTMLLGSSPTVRFVFGLLTLLTYGGFAGRKTTLPHDDIWDGTFDGRFEDKSYAIEIFERHDEEVKRRVPPGRLLVYEVKDGWGPLCAFLCVPEPEEPFPRLNDAAQMRLGMKAIKMLDAALPVALTLAVAATLLLLRGPCAQGPLSLLNPRLRGGREARRGTLDDRPVQARGDYGEGDPGYPHRHKGASLLHGEAAEPDPEESPDLVAQKHYPEKRPQVTGPEHQRDEPRGQRDRR
jgi:hypothetical protein